MKKLAQFKKKISLQDVLDNSMGIFLIVFNLCLVKLIYANGDILHVWQMFILIGIIYASMRFYQRYRTDTGNEPYRFMKGRRLGILFSFLWIGGVFAGLVADILVLMQF